jgi:hypothetical protein
MADVEAIKKPALDYIDAWYEGDSDRMERAVHPSLAKRIPRIDRTTGRTRIDHMTASQLVQMTGARRDGAKIPAEKRQKDVEILDTYDNIAVVRVVSVEYVDYLQVAKIDGRWMIVNVLWNRKTGTVPQSPSRATSTSMADQPSTPASLTNQP